MIVIRNVLLLEIAIIFIMLLAFQEAGGKVSIELLGDPPVDLLHQFTGLVLHPDGAGVARTSFEEPGLLFRHVFDAEEDGLIAQIAGLFLHGLLRVLGKRECGEKDECQDVHPSIISHDGKQIYYTDAVESKFLQRSSFKKFR